MRTRSCSGACVGPAICDAGVSMYEQLVAGSPAGSSDVPACVVRLGLLADGVGGEPTAVPPAAVAATVIAPIERAMAAERETLAAATNVLSVVEEAFARGQSGRQADVVLVRGRRQVEAVLERGMDGATEILTAHPGGGRSVEVLARVLDRDLPALRGGLRKRVVYQHTVRTHGPTTDYIDRIVAEGAQVRTLSELFDRLIVIDGSLAYVAGHERQEDELVEVRHPVLVRHLRHTFELAWRRAMPMPVRPAGRRPRVVVGDLQHSIMRLLVDGATDDAIARELGMSRRTVSVHVRSLSEQLGSRSRAQLGYAIAMSAVLEERA